MAPFDIHTGSASARQSKSRGAVLIGDDNVAFQESLADVLLDEGFDVITAHTGTEVIEAAHALAAQLQLLLLDVRMPSLSGLEAYRQLVAAGFYEPAIFLTTGPTLELKQQARVLGAVAVLDKLNLELAQLRRLVFAFTQGSPLNDLVNLLLDPVATLERLRPQPPAAPVRRGLPIRPNHAGSSGGPPPPNISAVGSSPTLATQPPQSRATSKAATEAEGEVEVDAQPKPDAEDF